MVRQAHQLVRLADHSARRDENNSDPPKAGRGGRMLLYLMSAAKSGLAKRIRDKRHVIRVPPGAPRKNLSEPACGG